MSDLSYGLVWVGIMFYVFAANEDILYKYARANKFNKYTALKYIIFITTVAFFVAGFLEKI